MFHQDSCSRFTRVTGVQKRSRSTYQPIRRLWAEYTREATNDRSSTASTIALETLNLSRLIDSEIIAPWFGRDKGRPCAAIKSCTHARRNASFESRFTIHRNGVLQREKKIDKLVDGEKMVPRRTEELFEIDEEDGGRVGVAWRASDA